MTSIQQNPDLPSYVYVLQPTDLLRAIEGKAPSASG